MGAGVGEVSGELTKYEAACRAVSEALSVDEIKEIQNAAAAMKAYARQAKNKQMESDAVAIRMRAERRCGEMMAEQPKAKGGGDQKSDHRVFEKPGDPITLARAGIDKNLAHRARTFAAMDSETFEELVDEARVAVERGVEKVVGEAAEKASERAPDFASPRDADRAILLIAERLDWGVLFPPPGILDCLKDAMSRASRDQRGIIKAAAYTLSQLAEEIKDENFTEVARRA